MPDESSSSRLHSESDSFEEKLAREMEDEYTAQWGIYEQGSLNIFLQFLGRPFGSPYAIGPLSVWLVYCGQTVGRLKMKLGMQVGLGPGHIVLHGDPGPPPPKEHNPPVFGPDLLWPNGWMDQDATWYEGRPQPRPHCVT